MCDVMAEELGQRDRKNQYEMGRYKYFFDVDGNGWSARFRRLMSTHSVVFKSTLYAECFSERIQPWGGTTYQCSWIIRICMMRLYLRG